MINDIEIESVCSINNTGEYINGPNVQSMKIRYDQKFKIDFLHDCTTEIMKLRKKRGL